MKSIKTTLSKSLKDNNYYNPNTINAVDGLLAYVVALLLMFLLGKVLDAPIKALVNNKVITDYFLWQIILGIITQGAILVVAIIFFKFKKVSVFSGNGYSFKTNMIDLLMSVLLVLGVGLCFNALHFDFYDDMTGIFGDLGLTVSQSVIDKSNFIYIVIYAFLLVPILPAIIEEMLFRGVVMRGMESKGAVFSIIGSSVLFSTMHGSVGMLILQFFVGLSIAVVVTLTKNHLYGVAMHFSNNLFLSVLVALPELASEFIPHSENVVSAFVTIFGLVFLLVSAFYFFKKYTAKFKTEILGIKKQKSRFDNPLTVCYTLKDRCDREYCLKDFDNLDKTITQNKDFVFLYKDEFCFLNKQSNNVLTYGLFVLALVLSLVRIFI